MFYPIEVVGFSRGYLIFTRVYTGRTQTKEKIQPPTIASIVVPMFLEFWMFCCWTQCPQCRRYPQIVVAEVWYHSIGLPTVGRLKPWRLVKHHWLVVSNIFYFHPYLGKIPILTNIFQMGWNHQLVEGWLNFRWFFDRLRSHGTGWTSRVFPVYQEKQGKGIVWNFFQAGFVWKSRQIWMPFF